MLYPEWLSQPAQAGERAAGRGTIKRIRLQQRQDARPILNIVVPHSQHLPLVAALPFFIVTAWASRISRCSLHFMEKQHQLESDVTREILGLPKGEPDVLFQVWTYRIRPR